MANKVLYDDKLLERAAQKLAELEYASREAAFAQRTDCLCEDTPPCCCDCSKCPALEDCRWLCENEPYRNAGE